MDRSLIRSTNSSTSSPAPSGRRRAARVLKHGDSFGVFDRYGDIVPGARRGGPVPRRHALPVVVRAAAGRQPSAAAELDGQRRQRGLRRRSDEPRRHARRRVAVPRGEIHVLRSRVLWDGGCIERIRCHELRGAADRGRRSRFASTPISPTCSRCAARAGRATRRAGCRTSGRREYVCAIVGLDGVSAGRRLRWSRRPTTSTTVVRSFCCRARTAADRDDLS